MYYWCTYLRPLEIKYCIYPLLNNSTNTTNKAKVILEQVRMVTFFFLLHKCLIIWCINLDTKEKIINKTKGKALSLMYVDENYIEPTKRHYNPMALSGLTSTYIIQDMLIKSIIELTLWLLWLISNRHVLAYAEYTWLINLYLTNLKYMSDQYTG